MVYIAVGGLILSGVGVFVLQQIAEVQNLMNNNPLMDFQIQSRVNELMLQCVEFSLLGFAVFILFSFSFALLMSHRIAGPQVAIKAYIDALKRGDYNYPRNLRPNDELTEIMTALKELAPILKERDKATSE